MLESPILWSAVKIAVALGLVLTIAPFAIWGERKISAYMQDRVGPNRAAAFGLFRLGGFVHNIADAFKMLFKEDIRPTNANGFFYVLAPFLVVVPAFSALAVIPWADDLQIPYGYAVPAGRFTLQIARLDVGLLYVFAISGLSVIGIMLAGWSSNNKYSLLGGLRSASQLISYEVSLTLAAVSMMVLYGTVRPEEMVARQAGPIWNWGVHNPVAFLIFLVAVFAESNRLPFDLPEGESELVAGYHVEYSGFKFGLFMLGEYTHMIVSSALISLIFFGGWQIPWMTTEALRADAVGLLRILAGGAGAVSLLIAVVCANRFVSGPRRWRDKRDYESAIFAALFGAVALGTLALAAFWNPPSIDSFAAQGIVAVAQLGCFVTKIGFFLFFYIWVRWTLPRFRFDQVMRLGWKMLMPLALLNIVATGLWVLKT